MSHYKDREAAFTQIIDEWHEYIRSYKGTERDIVEIALMKICHDQLQAFARKQKVDLYGVVHGWSGWFKKYGEQKLKAKNR